MNNIEKLAIEHGSTCYTGQEYHFERWQLEAFAKAYALQSSEPVAIGEVKENGVNWYKQNPHAHPIGTKFYTLPPSTVPLEEHNKRIAELEATNKTLLDALNELADHPRWGGSIEAYQKWINSVARQAIADAEGVE